jgi:hypothetical protein
MARRAENGTIKAVRGELGEGLADALVEFWTHAAGLEPEAARARLEQAVCVLVDDAGRIAGANSVYAADVELVGGRSFWIYRSFLLPEAKSDWAPMANAALLALESRFDPSEEGPVGVCFLIDDQVRLREHPEAEWLYPYATYAGYLPDGRQVRIRYFADARIGPPRPPDDFPVLIDRRYRVEPVTEPGAPSAEAAVDLWLREDVLDEEEARRRVEEVVVMATHDGEPVGVGTAYLAGNEQLGMNFWHYRAFVAAQHRASGVAVAISLVLRDRLEARFIGGQDTRGQGIMAVVENEMLRRYLDHAVWRGTRFGFIGENENGHHVRVQYFPGAIAPAPPK